MKAVVTSTMILFAIALVPFAFVNTFNSDEGAILNGAWKMFNGQRLYIDFFGFMAPGSYAWTLFSFYLLGPKYLSARVFALLLLLVSIWAVYGIALKTTGNRFVGFLSGWGWAFANYLSTIVINHNPQSSYAATIALYILIIALEKKRSLFFFASGLATGAVVFFLQTKGLLVLIGFILFLLWQHDRGRTSGSNIGSFLVGAALLPSTAVAIWTPLVLYEQLIQWPSDHYLEVNRVSIVPLLLFVGFYGVVVWLAAMWKKHTLRYLEILVVTQVVMSGSILTRPDVFHILWSSFSTIIVIAYVVWRYGLEEMFATRKAWERGVVVSLAAVLILFPVSIVVETLPIERRIRSELESYNIQSVYAHPFIPGLYFELGLNDPYPYYFLLTGSNTQREFNEQLSVLQRHQPSHVLVNTSMAEQFGFDERNPVDKYIKERYEEVGNIMGTTVVYRRREGSLCVSEQRCND